MINLTAEEQQFIKAKRAEDALNDKRVRYAMLVVEITAQWVQWSLEDGLGLTFSTFIDNFNVESRLPDEFRDHEKALYEAVKAMLSTADNQANKLTR